MASLVLNGNTSGSVTISSPAVSGTTTLTLPTTSGTVLTSGINTNFPVGSVLQVVNVLYGTATSSSSATYASSGLTASITPSSSSNKILVVVNMGSIQNNNTGNGVNFSLWKNSTALYNFGIINGYTNSAISIATVTSGGGISYLDAPATTSSTSYTVYFASNTGGQTVTTQANGAQSSITLMEIKG
jgi:hypothetical protein